MRWMKTETPRNDFFDLAMTFRMFGYKPQKNQRKIKKILKKIKYLTLDTPIHTKTDTL